LRDKRKEIEKYRLGKNDLLFARTGATVGKSYLIPGSIPEAVFASYLIRVRLLEDVIPKYVAYFFRSLDYWRQITETQAGIGQPNVNGTKLAQIKIPVAPLKQQKLIVAEIEKQFSRLDEAVANLKRVKANLKRYKASVLKAAVEGKLTEDWRKQHPDVEPTSKLLERILAERRAKWNGRGKYKEPSVPEATDLPSLPRGWVWATVDQVAAPEPNSITDGPFGSNLKTEHYKETGPRVIRLQNIGDCVFVNEEAHISEEHFARLQKHRIFAGDLVIAALGEDPPRSCLISQSVGHAIVKADCIRFKPHKDVGAKYLNVVLNSQPTRQRAKSIVHGVGRPRLNLGEIKAIVVPVPPTVEQQDIVAEVERRLSVIEELEAAVQANLIRADRLRQAVLRKAFSG
jgi:type I restriction enzyme, S subunit